MLKQATVRATRFSFLFLFVIAGVFFALNTRESIAQQNNSANVTEQQQALRVFLDNMSSYSDYLTLEIPYVNFVRDRTLAQVHIIMTTQGNGSGGTEYTLFFTGLQNFVGVDDTLRYNSMQMDTVETIREGILNVLTIGLVRYVSKTPLVNQIVVNRRQLEQAGGRRPAPTQVADKWNYWVFNTNESIRFTGESTRKTSSGSWSLSADRVTENWKLSYNISGSDQVTKNKLTIKDPVTKLNTTKWNRALTTSRTWLRYSMIKSLTDHWSAGAHGSFWQTTAQNYDLDIESAFAIEYNIFPYAESQRRQFYFDYVITNHYVDYIEETAFNKNKEDLVYESLEARFDSRERWGTLSFSAAAANYLHDLDMNRLSASATLSFRVLAGLSLDVSGSYTRVRDQVNIRKRGATTEEALLNLIQQATSFNFNTSVGLRYTFGSIYNNVVNPRFSGGI